MNLGTNDELNHGGDFANTALQPCARITVALSQDILVSWGGWRHMPRGTVSVGRWAGTLASSHISFRASG
jgi:hypothetical protein